MLRERHLVRFEGEDEHAGRALLARLEIRKIPAEPAAWRLQLGASSGAPGGLHVCSGEAFTLVIAAHDGYGNRCAQSQSILKRRAEALHRTHAIRPARHLPTLQACLLDSCQNPSSSRHACHEVRATLGWCALVTFLCTAGTRISLQRESPGCQYNAVRQWTSNWTCTACRRCTRSHWSSFGLCKLDQSRHTLVATKTTLSINRNGQ